MVAEKKQETGTQKKKTWNKLSEKEKMEIIRLYNTGEYSQEQIAKMTGRGSGTISVLINKYKPKSDTKPKIEYPGKRKTPIDSSQTKKVSKLSPLEKSLDHEVIELLEKSQDRNHEFQTSDKFVKEYYKKFGFERGIKIDQLIMFWNHRAEIIEYEKEKEQERKRKELLAVTGAANHPVREEPMRGDKRNAFADEGEQLVKINHRLAEMIAITGEILKVQKDTYTLFKEKIETGKKTNGVGLGNTTERLDK